MNPDTVIISLGASELEMQKRYYTMPYVYISYLIEGSFKLFQHHFESRPQHCSVDAQNELMPEVTDMGCHCYL
jgi:hypothetical protein